MEIAAEQFCCYALGSDLIKILERPEVADSLFDRLAIDGKRSHFKTLDHSRKLQAISERINQHRASATSEWRGAEFGEILAAAVYDSDLPMKIRLDEVFCDLREDQLREPVAQWLREKGLAPYAEIDMGAKRADLVGYRKGGLFRSEQIVGVELKSGINTLKTALNQMTAFAQYSHQTYLACPQALAIEYIMKQVERPGVSRFQPDAFDGMLKASGFGLLLVTRDGVREHLRPVNSTPSPERMEETLRLLRRRNPI